MLSTFAAFNSFGNETYSRKVFLGGVPLDSNPGNSLFLIMVFRSLVIFNTISRVIFDLLCTMNFGVKAQEKS